MLEIWDAANKWICDRKEIILKKVEDSLYDMVNKEPLYDYVIEYGDEWDSYHRESYSVEEIESINKIDKKSVVLYDFLDMSNGTWNYTEENDGHPAKTYFLYSDELQERIKGIARSEIEEFLQGYFCGFSEGDRNFIVSELIESIMDITPLYHLYQPWDGTFRYLGIYDKYDGMTINDYIKYHKKESQKKVR